MRYLKKFNEGKNSITLIEFLKDLNDAIKSAGFLICVSKDFGNHMSAIADMNVNDWDKYLNYPYSSFIEVIKIGDSWENDAYLEFVLGEFSIQGLKDECNKLLDDDKSTWFAPNLIKDEFDFLCTTILTFLDEKNYGEIKF